MALIKQDPSFVAAVCSGYLSEYGLSIDTKEENGVCISVWPCSGERPVDRISSIGRSASLAVFHMSEFYLTDDDVSLLGDSLWH